MSEDGDSDQAATGGAAWFWLAHSTGDAFISLGSVIRSGCRPCRIASTMSVASGVSHSTRRLPCPHRC